MKNGWFKLALLSFAGIIVSTLALGLINSFPQNTTGHNVANHSVMNSGTPDLSQQTMSTNPYAVNGMVPSTPYVGQQPDLWTLQLQIEQMKMQIWLLQNMLNNTNMNNSNNAGGMNNMGNMVPSNNTSSSGGMSNMSNSGSSSGSMGGMSMM